jgi:hypothetical protein
VAAQRPAQPRRHLDQQIVAVVVPERVVDLLEAVEVDQQQGGRPSAALHVGDRLAQAAVEEGAVGQVGEAVVQGLVAQEPRGARHDPEQRDEQHGQADAEQQVERQHVVADLVGHRRVGHVDLEHALRLRAEAESQRHVDLERPAALAVVGRAALEGGVRRARQRLGDRMVRLRAHPDQPRVVGVDDLVGAVEELHALELLVGVEPGLEHAVELDPPRLAERSGEVGGLQARLDGQLRDDLRQLRRAVQRPRLDLLLERDPEGQPERRDHGQAHQAEAPEERHASRPGSHGPLIGFSRRELE